MDKGGIFPTSLMPNLFNTFESRFIKPSNLRTLKNKVLTTFLILLSCAHVFSQTPGFMGKRWHFSVGLNVSPAFANTNFNVPFLNTIQELQVGYASGVHWETDAVFRSYQTIYDNRQELTGNKIVQNYYRINNSSFGAVFKHFKNNYVAPWGAYFMFGPVLNVVTADYDKYMHVVTRVSNHDTLIGDFGPSQQRFYKGDLLFGWGQHRVFKGRILLDYGFNCQLLALLGDFKFLDFTGSTTYTRNNYIEQTSAIRARGMNRFNLFMKIGLLF